MQRCMIPALFALVACAPAAGCSNAGQNTSNVVPTTATQAVTLDTFVGTWSSPVAGGSAATPNACSDLRYDISKAPEGQSATVAFNATCAGIVIAGTGSGSLAGSTLTWSSAGTLSRNGAQFCAFEFKDNTATPEGTGAIRVNYSGTVCGVPVSGSQVVRKP